jgi:dihydrofolate reductase
MPCARPEKSSTERPAHNGAGLVPIPPRAGLAGLGRRTYDVTAAAGWGWPYPVPGYVLTGQPPAEHPQGADITFTDRPLSGVVTEARERIADDRDVWVVGGAGVVRDFLAAGLVDQLRLFVPVMLGHGIRLFQPVDRRSTLTLQRVKELPEGMVELAYAVQR